MARCRFCDTEITWLKDGRKNIPVEGDGKRHECENFKKSRESFRKISPDEIDPDLIKQYEADMNNKVKKSKK